MLLQIPQEAEVSRSNKINSSSISDCPEPLAKWYCLNGATCFAVRIQDSILYNCWCPLGFNGLRCDYKYTEKGHQEGGLLGDHEQQHLATMRLSELGEASRTVQGTFAGHRRTGQSGRQLGELLVSVLEDLSIVLVIVVVLVVLIILFLRKKSLHARKARRAEQSARRTIEARDDGRINHDCQITVELDHIIRQDLGWRREQEQRLAVEAAAASLKNQQVRHQQQQVSAEGIAAVRREQMERDRARRWISMTTGEETIRMGWRPIGD